MTERKTGVDVHATTGGTAFGRVLSRAMAARGMATGPEEVGALGERSGLDGEALLALTQSDSAPAVGPLNGLAGELGLSGEEKMDVAFAYLYGRERGPGGG